MNVKFIMEILFALFLLTEFSLAASSRLKHCIRLAAMQGGLIALLMFCAHSWDKGMPEAELWITALITFLVKALLLPYLLNRAMIKVQVKRELEPLCGYTLSLLLVLGASAVFFLFSRKYMSHIPMLHTLASPVAFTGMFTGLFLIMARRKAITQALGFLVFENAITLFGIGMMLHNGWIVEAGILLDVFVLLFIMGITLFQIRSTCSHIDTDQLHFLRDISGNEKEEASK